MHNKIKMLRGLSLEALRKRTERATNFNWDDECVELNRRGYRTKWSNDNTLTLIKL